MEIKKKIKEYLRKFRIELFFVYSRLCNIKNKKNNDKDKNIMILVPRLNNGGAERVVSNLADELSKKFKVILVTKEEKKEIDYKCNVKRVVLTSKKENISRYLHFFKEINELKEIKKKENITHTISFCTQMNYLNVMSKVNDEIIISIRNYLSESEKGKKSIYMIKKSAKYADKIVAVSQLLAKEQIKKFKAKKKKVIVINNFCDKEKIDKKLGENLNQKKVENENIVLNVGRLTYQKGQIHLINSFRKVVDEIPNSKLLILGQGELKEVLEKRISDLNLNENVFLMGFQNNPYTYMKKSKVFVLSSFYEGMSNVTLEAMYCNLPVISTDCKTGTREILAPNTDLELCNNSITKEEYGILVPVIKNEEDENLLSEAIIEILKDKDLREKYSNKSTKRIKDFSKEEIMKKWINLIEG